MREIGVFLLAIVILFSSMSRGVVVADYLLNRDYIAKVLCVNRDKPEMKCNGKCHLAKQLKKQDEAEGQAGKSEKNVRTLDEVNLTTHAITSFIPALFSTDIIMFKGSTGSPGTIPSKIDHPPC
jgi:hypothetical protein